MIRELEWSPDVHAQLTHLASRDCLEWLGREVSSHVSQLWECSDGKDTLHLITRLDRNPTELVLCYAQGSGAGKFVPQFLERARERAWPVRLHTTDERLVRLARRHGFRLAEFVLRCSHGSVQ